MNQSQIVHRNPVVVFDTETIPDADHHQGDEFPKVPFHQVVAISFIEAHIEQSDAGSFYSVDFLRTGGEPTSSEAQLVKGFFQYIERKKPRLVSFNGRGFDLPVLKYRALKHCASAPWFARGESKWENYGQRYSVEWHCDLMDAFADFGASKAVKMDELCSLLDVPGKLGMDGSQVKTLVEAGKLAEVRDYCETDVLSTYLLFLRFALFRGDLTSKGHVASIESLTTYLAAERINRPHLGTFLDHMNANRSQEM